MSTSGGQVAPDFLAVLRNSGVEGLVAAIASVVENWLAVHGIEPGQDRQVSYKTWQEAFDRPPDGPVALVMMFDNWSIKRPAELCSPTLPTTTATVYIRHSSEVPRTKPASATVNPSP